MSIWKSAEQSETIKKHAPEDYDVQMAIGKGWEGIAHRLTEQIAQLDPDFKVNCIKEKFGSFRYYISSGTTDDDVKECVYTLIDKAEHEASQTCECCGSTRGAILKGMSWGWFVTLCDECRTTLEKERKHGIF